MLLMEGDSNSEAERRRPPPYSTPSNSDAWSLTAGNCEEFFRLSENVKLDECAAWTNEKHNSYIYHLEMSFVEQLYESKSIFAHYSQNNLRDIHISRKQLINVHNASEQYDVLQDRCWQKINCVAALPIFCSTSVDSHASLENKRTCNSKHRGMHCHSSPTKIPASLKLIGAWKQGKGIISHGIQKCPQEILSSKELNEDLIDSTREGMGQNFSDEDHSSALKFESRAKRLKIAIGDGLHQDQIASSRK